MLTKYHILDVRKKVDAMLDEESDLEQEYTSTSTDKKRKRGRSLLQHI
jgi:hypothetical protein